MEEERTEEQLLSEHPIEELGSSLIQSERGRSEERRVGKECRL